MLKLAKLAGLTAEYKRALLFPFFKRILRLEGSVRGKHVEIFVTRSTRIPTNMVAQIKLKEDSDLYFSAMRKRFGVALMKALGRPIVKSGDVILDRKIIFLADDINFAGKVFEYDETKNKFDALWSSKFSRGILVIGRSSIFYHEPAGILTQKKRERFIVAIDLLCDLYDILYFYRHKIS
ncbi:MAG: hypothetical protein LBS87_02560 [Puniceicoccales bacterium]|jgi:hypothetical protein|nr:hypothetical protein [Puniceicoccales bacterium]